MDYQGVIQYANQLAEDILGYKAGELNGLDMDRLIPVALRGKHAASVKSFLAAPATRRIGEGRDLWATRKDGHVVPVEIGLEQIIIEGHRYTVAALTDITHRIRRELSRRTLAWAQGSIAACEELGLAAAILTTKGVVLEGNRLYGSGRAVETLSLSDARVQRPLGRALRAVAMESTARVIMIPGNEKERPALIHLAPAPTRTRSSDEDILVVAIINLIETASSIPAPALVHLFGLTPAEIKVATCCRMGLRVSEIADRLNLSKETVKSQLGKIFTKTGVSSQTALAALLARIMVSEDALWADFRE